LGSLGIIAAKLGAHVTFVDSCLARLRAAHARAEQHNLNNTQFIACKSWNSLPSDLGAFDAILLNGILEWLPTASGCQFDTVLDTQIDFLFKMQQILRENGKILLAIENRFALQYFMGYPEDHTDIQYLSIMSRNKANEVHLKEKGTEFLAWTWSLNEYKKLLPKAHLKLADAYAIFPDYRFPRLIVSLDDKQGLRNGMLIEKYNAPKELKKRFIDYIYEMGMIGHFVYSYSFLLEKGVMET
jgi:cyclopropane fatty-acyl-phospholipid synthase-like methyltransferase